jgi:PAS domain S-box-containing protein
MSPAAEQLTGWTEAEARRQPLDEVFRIIDKETRAVVESRLARMLRWGQVRGFTNQTTLIAKDGRERPIAGWAAPIRDEAGAITGVVVVFRGQTVERPAQEALCLSEIRYRRLFETAKDGILIADAETGMVLDANPFLTEKLGISQAALLGKKIWELGFLKDVASSHANFAELQREQYVRYDDLPLEAANGRMISVEFVSNVYLEGHRKVVQCNIRDTTERSRAEEREKLGRDVLERLNDPQNSADTIRDILAMVKKSTGCEAVGVRLREGDDFPYSEVNGFPDRFVEMERHLSARDEAGEVVRDAQGYPVLECMCGNILCGRTNPALPFFTAGGSFWTNCTTDLLASTSEEDRQGPTRNRCNAAGYESVALVPLRVGEEIIGLLQLNDRRRNQFTRELIRFFEGLGASIGIALARKRAEEALRESEAKYRELFDNAGDAILIADAATAVILDANKAAETLLGRAKHQIVGISSSEIHPAGNRSEHDEEFQLHVGAGRVTDADSEVIRKDGTIVPVRISAAVIAVEGRKVIQGIFRDITERKRAEAEHEDLMEQLRVSQKMEAIGSLAGGIAHDFNNLLSVILSYTGFALERIADHDTLRDDLLEVKKAAERAAALTHQLLAFSRKQILQPVPLDLNQAVAGIEKMLQRIIGEDIDLVQTLAPDLGLTLVDPGQVDQVIMNLVINARDAMPDGGGLAIETANVELDEDSSAWPVAMQPGPYVLLAVTDTGCGMDEETRARLFEPFFTTKEKGKGTGLGLSTVYGIIRQSGGGTLVYSEPGKGTTFKIYLPRVLSAVVPAPRSPAVVTHAVGTETILVIEDEEAVRNLTRRILRAAGYSVLTAANGDEALLTSEAHQGGIHLVVTDVVMPQMSGRAVVERLAQVRPEIKVLYMSGYSGGSIGDHGLVEPGIHFIAKPFTAVDLVRQVHEVLDADRR